MNVATHDRLNTAIVRRAIRNRDENRYPTRREQLIDKGYIVPTEKKTFGKKWLPIDAEGMKSAAIEILETAPQEVVDEIVQNGDKNLRRMMFSIDFNNDMQMQTRY